MNEFKKELKESLFILPVCRQGIPDYLVTFRKNGENPDRVEHTDGVSMRR